MGINSLARNCRCACITFGFVCRSFGWRSTSFEMVCIQMRVTRKRILKTEFSIYHVSFSALILFSVCGLLAVTGSWLMSGLYLSSSVAVGDLCMDPAEYLVSQKPRNLPSDILLYYTQCESIRSNPFTLKLRESQNALNNARSAMNIVSR